MSTLCSLDSVSQSYKRKILECEKEDFEDRFGKIQRKRQMLRATAKANLVIDDDDNEEDDDLDEQEIFEQMEWIEDEKNSMTLHLWKDKDVDLSIQSINSGNPIMYIPKFNWREERRHLLRISMAKIRGVDDPETYLRRSVLINNTVKRLQKDVAITYRYPPLASASVLHENVTSYLESNWDSGNSNDEVVCKNNYSDGSGGFQCSRFVGNGDYTTTIYNYPDVQTGTPYNFHLSLITPFSPDKSTDSLQNEISQNSIFSKSLQEDQSICDPSLSCRTLKQTHPVHVYSSQPCGLQYRNASHDDSNGEYPESNTSSSILDSVVYHSLIASLET